MTQYLLAVWRSPCDCAELPERLPPVLAVVYLTYTEGHTATDGDELVRAELCTEAIRLTLPLLLESRRAARTAADGSVVLLADQDRRRWDRALIDEGQALVRECLRRNAPGPYQVTHPDAGGRPGPGRRAGRGERPAGRARRRPVPGSAGVPTVSRHPGRAARPARAPRRRSRLAALPPDVHPAMAVDRRPATATDDHNGGERPAFPVSPWSSGRRGTPGRCRRGRRAATSRR